MKDTCASSGWGCVQCALARSAQEGSAVGLSVPPLASSLDALLMTAANDCCCWSGAESLAVTEVWRAADA